MYGHGLSRAMEAWHKRYNGDETAPEWRAFLDDFRAGLADKSEELLEAHSNAGRFGMSKAGGCTRAASLKALGHEAEPFSGSTRVTFFIGHMCEVLAISTLRAMGFVIDGTQRPVTIDPFMHSYSDGIIVSAPPEYNIAPGTILSVKSAGYKKSGKGRGKFVRRGFPELPFEGVRSAQPGWWAQLQSEMHGTSSSPDVSLERVAGVVPASLVVVVSKDIIKSMEDDPYLGDGDGKGNGSLTFYAEAIAYDPQFCARELIPVWQDAWDSVEKGIASKPMFLSKTGGYNRLTAASLDWQPNAGLTESYNPCSYCDLISACQTELASSWRKGRAA